MSILFVFPELFLLAATLIQTQIPHPTLAAAAAVTQTRAKKVARKAITQAIVEKATMAATVPNL